MSALHPRSSDSRRVGEEKGWRSNECDEGGRRTNPGSPSERVPTMPAWHRTSKAKRELEAEQAAREHPGNSRAARLEEAKRRLAEQHALERHAIEAEQAASAKWLAEQREREQKPTGRRRIHPLVVSQQPAGRVNVTDPDSRPVKTTRGFIQGYSGQAAATEDQIIVDSTQRKAGRSTASASG